ncbi:DNA polymerase III subunit gamma/tau [Lachnospiraceae bacterium ZAX-1]
MSYTALYRKFRPQEFEDVKGQEHIATTLKNQIKAERIGHAYLFCGTRGTGKTSVAKIFAKAVNCEQPNEGSPCLTCASCRSIGAGTSMNVIEIDAASNNGVDNIREIKEEVSYSPTQGKYRVYIIDEVHMLSIGAFNALLKTLEEPPSYVIFILATTEAHKIPITILSRCQRYDFRRITIDTISKRLTKLMEMEQVEVEEKAIRYLAKSGDGSMRDALSLLDQCIAFYLGQKLTYDKVLEVLGTVDTEVFRNFLRNIVKQDITAVIVLLEEIIIHGREPGQFVVDFTWYLRNLLLIKSSDHMEDVLDMSGDNLILLREEAKLVRIEELMRFIRIFSELSNQIRYATQKRILIEIALIKLCKPQMEQNLESLLERVGRLEEKIEKGVALQATQASSGNAGRDTSNTLMQNAEMADTAIATDKVKNGPVLQKAIPQDVQYVVKNFRAIIQGLSSDLLKNYLKKARLSLGAENQLLIIFDDEMAEGCVNTDVHKKELTDAISNKIGKEVAIRIQRNESGGAFEESYVDIEKIIHMDIEVEEDE